MRKSLTDRQTDRPTDRQTNRPTDRVSYRAAQSQLKMHYFAWMHFQSPLITDFVLWGTPDSSFDVRGTSASTSTVGQVKQIVYNPFKIEMKEIVKGKKKCLEKCKYDVDEKKLSYFIMLKKKSLHKAKRHKQCNFKWLLVWTKTWNSHKVLTFGGPLWQ